MIHEGTEYTRVTDVLWTYAKMDKVPPHILIKASIRGNKVHALDEARHQGLSVPNEHLEGIEGYALAYNIWALGKEFYPRPARIFDSEHRLTGEIDGLYKSMDGKYVLYDLKTSRSFSETWILQMAAYNDLLKSQEIFISHAEIVHLHKNGEYETYQYSNFTLNDEFKHYLCALRLHRRFKMGKDVHHEAYEI